MSNIKIEKVLPNTPNHRIKIINKSTEFDEYIKLNKFKLKINWSEDTNNESEEFNYYSVEHKVRDAVVIIPYFIDEDGEVYVILRSSIRPPIALYDDTSPVLWEVPAGFAELDETSKGGLKRAAARELHEEVGAKVDVKNIYELGDFTYPSPGISGEKHHYFCVEVNPDELIKPVEDGSELEKNAELIAISINDLNKELNDAKINDSKSEIAIRRFTVMLDLILEYKYKECDKVQNE